MWFCRYLEISFHPFAKNQPVTFIHVFSSICKKQLNTFILYLFIIYLQNQPTFIHSFIHSSINVSPLHLFDKLILHSCIYLPPPMHHPPHTVPLSLSLSLHAHAPRQAQIRNMLLLGSPILDLIPTILDDLLFIYCCTIAQKSVVWGFIFPTKNFSQNLWWNYNYEEYVYPNSSNNVE
jgi:hypothetical protein